MTMCINNGSLSKIDINSGSFLKFTRIMALFFNDLRQMKILDEILYTRKGVNITKTVVFKSSYFSYFRSQLYLFKYVLLMFHNSKKQIQMFHLKK